MAKKMIWKRFLMPLTFDAYSKKDIFIGLGITTFAILGIFSISITLGFIEITNLDFNLNNMAYDSGLIFLSAGYEELVFRCIILTILIKLLKNPWLSLLITSIYFGYVHLDNDHATLLSAFSNAIGGIMYGLAFIYTRKIWFPWALHFAWNYVQALVGFPISGFEAEGMINLNIVDHSWLSGGLYGPEGGIVGIVFRFIVIILIVIWLRKSRGELKSTYQPYKIQA